MIESILIILVLGLTGNFIFFVIKLPGLLGMIIAGVIIGPYGYNLLDDTIRR